MSDKNSLLIAGLCATMGLLVVSVVLGTFTYYKSSASSAFADMEANLAAELAAKDRTVNTRPPAPLSNNAALTRAHAQMNDLQTMLARNNRLLKNRTTKLDQKTAECQALQEQLDGSIATALELLTRDTDEGSSETRQQLSQDLEKELKQLKTELERSEALELEQMQQVVQLKSDLAETEAEIAELRDATNDELLSLLEQQQVLDATARRAFTQLGAAAVPVLVDLLSDERADVRIWSASVLGGLGEEGNDAVPALMGMLVDENKTVRDQAKRSLEQLAN
jgi:chromosome segregation ATPase